MTEVGLGRIQALGPKWVAGYGPCRKWALLQKGSKKQKYINYVVFENKCYCVQLQWPQLVCQSVARSKPLGRALLRRLYCGAGLGRLLALPGQPPVPGLLERRLWLWPLPLSPSPRRLGRSLPVFGGPGWRRPLPAVAGHSQLDFLRLCPTVVHVIYSVK